MTRLVRRLIILAVLVAAAAWLKEVLDEPDAEVDSRSTGSAATDTDADDERPSSNGATRTKAELYEQAQKLDIEGRSKMSKAELERAIRDA